jgi:CRP-like cAMP-binding protein
VTEHEDRPIVPHTSGLFAELEPGDVEALLAVGQVVFFSAGEPIFEVGDDGDSMFVIVSGEARVDVGGRFHVLRAGDFFGEMALLAPGKRMATVRAENDVQTLRISAEEFRQFVVERPGVALSVMKVLVLRLREVEQRIDAWMA